MGSAEPIILAADDPRHGTLAGRSAHLKTGGPICGPCRTAYNRWEKRNRARLYMYGPACIDALGTQRRIRALAAIGHTLRSLDQHVGRRKSYSAFILTEQTVTRATAAAYADLYERLCMDRPMGVIADRTRLVADRKGWPPPLAWDDIDDPDENPTDWHYTPADRHAQLDDLLSTGATLSDVLRCLSLSTEALEKWMDRNDRRDDFNRLVQRMRGAA